MYVLLLFLFVIQIAFVCVFILVDKIGAPTKTLRVKWTMMGWKGNDTNFNTLQVNVKCGMRLVGSECLLQPMNFKEAPWDLRPVPRENCAKRRAGWFIETYVTNMFIYRMWFFKHPWVRGNKVAWWPTCEIPGDSSRDLFEMVKWPLQRLSDLQIGDKKVTTNHLVTGLDLSTFTAGTMKNTEKSTGWPPC